MYIICTLALASKTYLVGLSNKYTFIILQLKSYGDALTLRHIDCSNPAEQLMLTQFSIIMPLIRTFDLKFREQFNCRHRYYHHWIDENLLDTYRPEINYLQQLNGVPLS